MNKYYIIIFLFLLGMIGGILQNDLVVPVLSEGDGAYYHGIRGFNQISLTFNVDWGEKYINSILKILKDKEIKATFFITGNWAQKNPELVKKIADKGHEIGNHGYKHLHPVSLNKEQLISLIKNNEKIIYDLTGQKTNLFAPPYGEVNQRISTIVSSIGYKTILWSADTIDWQRPSSNLIVERAVNKVSDGGIILMHPTQPSVKALSDIINRLKNRGFKFVTVSQLIGMPE